MLRSLQTLKSSTSTWSCLLVPAVAMIKGTSPLDTVNPILLLCSLAWVCYSSHDIIVLLLLVRMYRSQSSRFHLDTVSGSKRFLKKRNVSEFHVLPRICFPALWLIISMKQAADLCRRSAIPSCLCFICFPISIHHTHPSSTPLPIRPIWTENARGSSTPGLWY